MSRRSRKVVVRQSTGQRLIEQSRVRLLCIGLFFMLCFGSIAVRMIDVAVIQNAQARIITVSDADNNEEKVEVTKAAPIFERGDIVDRNGELLATSVKTASIFANPKEIRDPEKAAQKLAKILGIDAKKLAARMSSDKSFVWLKRNLTPVEQQKANSLGVPGLYFLPEERRIYPYGNLFAHMVGYVGVDNKGLAGTEKYFDRRLRDSAKNKEQLALSLDVRLQAIMREEMHNAMRKFKAIGATGVIMDLESDELLSVVSLPDFDPHNPGAAKKAARFNRATLGVYEMGSTFKSFTMAMGLEHDVVSMKGGYDATNPFKVSSFTIKDSHPKKRWLNVPEIFAYSSNIGTAKMALDVGIKRQKEFMKKLGMLEGLSLEVPEKSRTLYPDDWKEINAVTISYGHGISVTPLHLVRGIAAMVNGGELPKLTLVKDKNKGKKRDTRVISEATSKNMRRLMRLVVDYGTGGKAHVPGYRVGGKTGTAEKVSKTGRYNQDAKLASFVGAFPVDDPKYVILVMIDEPKGIKSTYGFATGGWISAPVVGNIISRMGPLYAMKPRFDVPEDDAQKYWVHRGNSKPRRKSAPAKKFIHAATY
ncbi:MAG: peptidoglycan D,D-transpeptidase FtsI family protein [Rickettsiales bacterium]